MSAREYSPGSAASEAAKPSVRRRSTRSPARSRRRRPTASSISRRARVFGEARRWRSEAWWSTLPAKKRSVGRSAMGTSSTSSWLNVPSGMTCTGARCPPARRTRSPRPAGQPAQPAHAALRQRGEAGRAAVAQRPRAEDGADAVALEDGPDAAGVGRHPGRLVAEHDGDDAVAVGGQPLHVPGQVHLDVRVAQVGLHGREGGAEVPRVGPLGARPGVGVPRARHRVLRQVEEVPRHRPHHRGRGAAGLSGRGGRRGSAACARSRGRPA